MNRDTIRRAAELFVNENIRGALVGTCALWFHGCTITPDDVDFMVERAPSAVEKHGLPGEGENVIDSSTYEHEMEGVRFHFIVTEDETRKALLAGERTWIDGVPVLNLDGVIALKRYAGRWKDNQFLRGWDAARSLGVKP